MDAQNAVAMMAGSITVAGGAIAGVLWLVASKLAPMEKAMLGYVDKFETVVANNTKAMDRIEAVVTRHDAALDDHSERIVRLETTHRINGCEERR